MPQSNKPVLDNDPDSFSTADNNSNSTDVFVNRVKYRDEIFPDAAPFSYFNFWEEDRYYGRINSLGNAVVLREDRLKQLKYCDAPTPLFAFNFVADAWRDFVEKTREATTGEKLIHMRTLQQPKLGRASRHSTIPICPILCTRFSQKFSCR